MGRKGPSRTEKEFFPLSFFYSFTFIIPPAFSHELRKKEESFSFFSSSFVANDPFQLGTSSRGLRLIIWPTQDVLSPAMG